MEKIKDYIINLFQNTELKIQEKGKVYCLLENDCAFIGPHVDITLFNENKEFIFHTFLRNCQLNERTILVYDIDNNEFSNYEK